MTKHGQRPSPPSFSGSKILVELLSGRPNHLNIEMCFQPLYFCSCKVLRFAILSFP